MPVNGSDLVVGTVERIDERGPRTKWRSSVFEPEHLLDRRVVRNDFVEAVHFRDLCQGHVRVAGSEREREGQMKNGEMRRARALEREYVTRHLNNPP